MILIYDELFKENFSFFCNFNFLIFIINYYQNHKDEFLFLNNISFFNVLCYNNSLFFLSYLQKQLY